MFHRFKQPVAHIPLPEEFTYPFRYTPHPLCLIAAKEVQQYIGAQKAWEQELQNGKMFGVMVVKDPSGNLGYLSAFSGNLSGKCRQPFFVPPIYDLSNPCGFFKKEETEISKINQKIEGLQNNTSYQNALTELEKDRKQAYLEIFREKEAYKQAKAARDMKRQNHPLSEEEEAAMIKESQFQKAEIRRMEKHWKEIIHAKQAAVEQFESATERLRNERKQRSALLQEKLFEHYIVLNALGQSRSIRQIFSEYNHTVPPAGTGECAAPKMLQYAYLNQLHPIAMAEFWYGGAPDNEIRRNGFFYPACESKCRALLSFMLKGLQVEKEPSLSGTNGSGILEIVYEDTFLMAINKPAGMLSVPGKAKKESVYSLLCKMYPHEAELFVVHRLDMDTSGLLLVAKNRDIYKRLQVQFSKHSIKKKYIALLDGVLAPGNGTISLPICANPADRPRQAVDLLRGKAATTHYEILATEGNHTRVCFYPVTGRTHQLRIHAAHPQGLDCPILGDYLYGKPDKRLYLHAEEITFLHPVTDEPVTITKKADF